MVFVPSRGFLFFYKQRTAREVGEQTVFVPSRGFLFFYRCLRNQSGFIIVFVPSRGFLFFYDNLEQYVNVEGVTVFVPSRGFLFFYGVPL